MLITSLKNTPTICAFIIISLVGCGGGGAATLSVNEDGDPKVIALWDVVPFQRFSGPFNVGIVAFHKNGISHVEFSIDGGPITEVNSSVLNPRTGVNEFIYSLDASSLVDGLITVSATVHAVTGGVPRVLELPLYANNGGSLIGNTVYVATTGTNAPGNGSTGSPYATIAYALKNVEAGGTIILQDEGTHTLTGTADVPGNTMWITVRSDDAINPDNVILAHTTRTQVRFKVNQIKFQKVSFDTGTYLQYYPETNHIVWFDQVRWFDSNGWVASYPLILQPVRTTEHIGGYYVTSSTAEDQLYGFVDAHLVRNSRMEMISGDLLQNTRLALNNTIDNVDGGIRSHHTDLLQYFGDFENIIVYGLKATNIKETQNMFLDHFESSFTNMAFVNIAVENFNANPPFIQLNSMQDHVIFAHISTPGQNIVFRDDFTGSKKFTAKDVVFINCIFENMKREDKNSGVPDGVSVVNSHFVAGEAHGVNATAGPVILSAAGASFTYTGSNISDITNTGEAIHNLPVANWEFGSASAPNKGAFPF